MKEVFIIWITLQLMVIGYWDFWDRNAMFRHEFKCEQVEMKREIRTWIGVLFPLSVLTTKSDLIKIELCK